MKQTVKEITRLLREQGKAFNDAADTLNGVTRKVDHHILQPPKHGNTGRHMSVETRKKMSESQKARHAQYDHKLIESATDPKVA
jgi:hypothetical protein